MQTETIGKLASALAKAQAEITGAAKDANNPHFGSKYADLASVWDACRGPLTKHEIAVVQRPSADGNKVTVETVLLLASGESLAGSLTCQARDAGPQSIGSAITYLRRYGLAAMVGVAPEDDDAEAAEGRAKQQAPQMKPQAPSRWPAQKPVAPKPPVSKPPDPPLVDIDPNDIAF
jgi:hypothetical protein